MTTINRKSVTKTITAEEAVKVLRVRKVSLTGSGCVRVYATRTQLATLPDGTTITTDVAVDVLLHKGTEVPDLLPGDAVTIDGIKPRTVATPQPLTTYLWAKNVRAFGHHLMVNHAEADGTSKWICQGLEVYATA